MITFLFERAEDLGSGEIHHSAWWKVLCSIKSCSVMRIMLLLSICLYSDLVKTTTQ